MKKIPCKKCPKCGLFNDFTIEECECGENLSNVGAQLIIKSELSPEQCGEIDSSLNVYVQKCSACGALNYTDDSANPVKMCYNCHKTRIASIVPVEYVDTDGGEGERVAISAADESPCADNINTHTDRHQMTQVVHSPAIDEDDDDEDDDHGEESVYWKTVFGGIAQKTGSGSSCASQTNQSQGSVKNTIAAPIVSDNSDGKGEEDEDDDVDWSGILGGEAKQSITTPEAQTAASTAKKSITLTAIRYGQLSFTVEAGANTYMLGRSANQGSFLSQDGRVGNEHCYLFCKNGDWFVRDNNSSNGTAVNSQDIGSNGESMLRDGDELKLGHHSDSMAFRLSIG